LDENRQLKDEAFHLKQELNQKEVQLRNLDAHPGQILSGQGTKEGQSEEKHIEALRALTAVTKTQQESLAAHHQRSEALHKQLDERDLECKRLRKELQKKKKEVTMLEKEIDSNLLEIAALRKELVEAQEKYKRSEAEMRSDRTNMLELTGELALIKSGQSGSSNDEKLAASRITDCEGEVKEKKEECESLRIELERQVKQIQRLHTELERTQQQVQAYEKERDATIADMETYYEALKFELEEKSRMLEAAEREKEEMDIETTAAIRALQDKCDQLNSEVLDAHDEMSLLRRENDASSFAVASVKNDAAKEDIEEERKRLNATIESLEEELDILKSLHEQMKVKHTEALKILHEENGELKRHLSEFKVALREANAKNQTISEKNEMMKIENESLMEISRDLQLKLRNENTRQERDATPYDTTSKKVSSQEQSIGADPPPGDSALSMSHSSLTNLNPVLEDSGEENESISNGENSQKPNGSDSSSTCFSDEAVMDPQASPPPSEGELMGQHALLLAGTQSKTSSPASSDDGEPSGQQAMLLAAVAGKKMQKAQSEKAMGSSWRSKISMKRNQNNTSKSLSPIPGDSPSIGDSQEAIKNLKSEIVRLNAFYRDAAYIAKKKIESLTHENAAYEIKVSVLETMLQKLGGSEEPLTHTLEASVVDTGADPNDESAGPSWQEDGVTPQRESSPQKFLDRIKELEEQVSELERKKNFVEAKMKAVESDLENHQQHARIAARDSLLEAERLKRQNAELQRKLLAHKSQVFDSETVVSDKEAVGEGVEWG
jgi:chromosome segregation ATPase